MTAKLRLGGGGLCREVEGGGGNCWREYKVKIWTRVVSPPGSSRLWRSLSPLSRFPMALKLLKNRQAMQARLQITILFELTIGLYFTLKDKANLYFVSGVHELFNSYLRLTPELTSVLPQKTSQIKVGPIWMISDTRTDLLLREPTHYLWQVAAFSRYQCVSQEIHSQKLSTFLWGKTLSDPYNS